MFRPLLLLGSFLAQTLAIPTISAKGSKLFTSDGAQFYIKGIAYQLTNDDPLANTNQCELDVALMKTLGTNSIRVYHVDASLNHDGCMSAFADAGIYAWVDLDTFDTYLLPADGVPIWNETMFHAYSAVMDTFVKYDNTAGFFVGNEMLTTGESSIAAPYIKAAAQDMKAYRDNQGYRDIPVGYSAADIPALRPNLQNYLACGDNSSEALDFYSLNAYEWCSTSGYVESGYNILEKNASQYNIPIFFSETGCIIPPPRYFDDQAAILGPEMDSTWSGAIIYEWVQEVNMYGIIEYGPPTASADTASGVIDGYTLYGTPTPISPDFTNLQNQWATLTPTGTSKNDYTPSLTPPACPSYTSGFWEISGNAPLPTLGVSGAQYTRTTGSGSGAGSSASGSSTSSGASAATSKSAASSRHSVLGLTFSRRSSPTHGGTGAVESWFTRLSVKHHAVFWVVGLVCAIVGPAIVM